MTCRYSFVGVAFAALTLTACNQPVRITPPPVDLQTCADEPKAPELPERDGTEAVQLVRDQMVLGYILALRSAWGDCRSKVDGIRAWSGAVE